MAAVTSSNIWLLRSSCCDGAAGGAGAGPGAGDGAGAGPGAGAGLGPGAGAPGKVDWRFKPPREGSCGAT